MRYTGFLPLLVAALAVTTIAGARAESSGASDTVVIRNMRLEYNHAIEARKAEAFARFLSPSFVELASTGEVTSGAKAVADSYAADEFKDPTFIAYDREPDSIEISRNGRFAVERGHWRARFREPSGSEIGGSGYYQAGWIRMDGGWRIQTEAYVRLTCKQEPAC